ncbi:SAM-dependent methyltransferase [Mizugakiibacter sediminis]|uniref:SAM-dependent methyltransferase n=1 Tax=Mizugakiibacter sediminis TaxID=1475481 RepID=A0A0K8QJH1_9GAMM|nr:SAM-dependent methyltransferase [Mizugakiibacter sediminis]
MEPAVSEGIAYPALYLKRGEDARLRAGHLWVFSNEVDVARSPLTGFTPGEPCVIVDARDRPLGVGYVNPNSLICARLVGRGLEHALDRSLLTHRLKVALGLRERLYGEPYYRLLYGEADGAPGLTLDRFGDVVVAQATTAGIERLKPEVEAAVRKVLNPAALLWKNDAAIRALEGLPSYADVGFGAPPGALEVREGGLAFAVDAIGGQKTGWFYDQRANRDLLAPFVRGARVLDMFSYLGAWGLRAAAMGAREVVCVDASAHAVEAIAANARRNGLAERVRAERADAFEYLKALRERREHFDVVILDPPAFVKRKKDLAEGRLAYRRLNELGMQALARDGILVTCSCSYHMPRQALLDGVQQGARHLDRQVQVLMQLQQAPDHPVHPAIPETDYLKGYLCRVLPA